jgi:hypothetical protein
MIRKDVVVASSRYSPGICQAWLRKDTQTLTQSSTYPGRISLEYEFKTLLPTQTIRSKSQKTVRVRVRVNLRLAVYRQSVGLGDKPLETHDQQFFLQLNSCGYSPYVTSYLTKGRICSLQLLLAFASAVILRSFYCLCFETSPTWRLVLVFISLRNRVARLHTQAPSSIFVGSYDSQGYGGGIRTPLHKGGGGDNHGNLVIEEFECEDLVCD